MERIDDTIKIHNRDEIRDLINALECIPEEDRNQATKDLLYHLGWMETMW